MSEQSMPIKTVRFQELASALFGKMLTGNFNIKVNHQFSLDEVVKAHCTLESGMTTDSMILLP